MKRPDRITRCLVVLALLAGAACSNKKEIRAAKASVYDADFAIVFSEVVAAVRELYPNLDEDPAQGTVRTAWHQVQFSTGADDHRTMQQRDSALADPSNAGGPNNFTTPTSAAYKRLFIRFDVTVTGGRPWRIKITGKASEWDPGNAQPTELRGAATPHWLPGRKDGLLVAIYRRLKKYAIQVEQPAEEEVEEEVAVDLGQFGDVPEGAAKAAAALVAAVEARDIAALRAGLADDVVWSFGAAGDADTAIAMWQADPDALESLGSVLSLGCRKDAADAGTVTCPPAATEEPGYLGWRATLALDGEVWKLTSFVKGD